jgi:hypothetical protein
LSESKLEKKFQSVITVCEDFRLNIYLDKCVVMKISWKTETMGKTKDNDHEMKEMESCKYIRSIIMTHK